MAVCFLLEYTQDSLENIVLYITFKSFKKITYMRIVKALFILILTAYGLPLFAHGDDPNENITPYNDALESIQGYKIQHLKKQAAWQGFIAQNPDWGARFNRYTRLPHRALGTPIQLGNPQQDAVAKSLQFLQNQLAAFELPVQELISTRNFNDGKYVNVDFKQVHQGMEVMWSRVLFRYSQEGDLVLFGLDAHRNIANNLPMSLTAQQAQQSAESALVGTVIQSKVSANKMIIPVPVDGNYEYHVVFEVLTDTKDDGQIPGKYLSYVDAETGKVWYRDNEVKQIGFDVNANIYPTNLYNPSQIFPLKNLRITSGGNTYYTNATTGNVNIPGTTFSGTIHLDGSFCDIVTTQNGTTSPSIAPSAIMNNGTFTFPTAPVEPQIQHFSAYYHVNEVHDFMKQQMPLFTAMDNPLTTRIDRTDGSCNAFYNGNSINFYETAGGCNALSLVNTVVYHEYGHGISNQFYASQGQNFRNGGMGEGYSDVWATFLNDGPIVGEGITSTNSNIRRYDINPKVYPQDIQGQVHADGEIIAGAWWDTYQYWGSLDSISYLFGQSHYGLANAANGNEGELYFDILIDALQYDDDDNNIGNGTPHFTFIVKGFADHGIYLLNNSEVLHSGLGYQVSGTPLTLDATVLSDFSPFVGDVTMRYRKRGTTGSSSVVMNKNGLDYDVLFPSQTAGDIFEYYFDLADNTNSYEVDFPKNSEFSISTIQRNIPYYLMIGYTPKYQELFDGSSAPSGWTIGNMTGDNASRGIWEHGVPVPSFADINDTSTIIQTYRDANYGGKCLVTGNAVSATASIGSADVDGGTTSVLSPSIDISSYNQPVLGYSRWYSNSQGSNPRKDFWQVQLSYDGGGNWFNVDRTLEPDRAWRWQVVPLFKSQGTNILVRFRASDIVQGNSGGSLVEAAIDAFEIYDLGETPLATTDFEALDMKVYPNPASESVTIGLPGSEKGSYEILSSVGQVLSVQPIAPNQNTVRVETAHLADGIYYVRVYQAGKMSIEKLTIQK